MTTTLFSGMLDAHKHSPPIGRPANARDLALPWPNQETLDFTGPGIAQQHLIVALPGKISPIGYVPVCRNPKTALAVEFYTIWRVEHIVSGHVPGTRPGIPVDRRVPRHDEKVPGETRCGVVGLYTCAQ